MTSNDSESDDTTTQESVQADPAAAAPAAQAPPDEQAPPRKGFGASVPSVVALGLGGALLVGGGFLGGYVVKDATTDTPRVFQRAAESPGGLPGRIIEGHPEGKPDGSRGPRNLTLGTIESVDGDTLTLKTASGKTVKVKVADGTKITVTSEGSVSDLKNGDKIIVHGDKDDEGNVNADSITEGRTDLRVRRFDW